MSCVVPTYCANGLLPVQNSMVLSTRASTTVHTAYAGDISKKMISLRNLQLVARMFHFATRLNNEKEPTQDDVNKAAVIKRADTLRCLIFISFGFRC